MKAIGIRLVLFFIAVSFVAVPFHAFASDKSSACVEMVEKAQTFLKEKGERYALRVFSVSKGPFIDKELYVFACSMDNKLLAHPYRQDLVGEDVNNLKDAKGKPLFQEFRRIAEERGSGWVDYWWTKPGEQGEFPKMTYIKRLREYNMYVGVGYYTSDQLKHGMSRADKN